MRTSVQSNEIVMLLYVYRVGDWNASCRLLLEVESTPNYKLC